MKPRSFQVPWAKILGEISVCLFSPFIVMLIMRNWRRAWNLKSFFKPLSPFIISSLKMEQKKGFRF